MKNDQLGTDQIKTGQWVGSVSQIGESDLQGVGRPLEAYDPSLVGSYIPRS